MLHRILIGIFAGAVVYLICIALGTLLIAMHIDVTIVVGGLLKSFAGLLSLLAFVYYGFLQSPPRVS